MFLKTLLHLVCFSTFINFHYCFQYPNLLKDNFDLKVLKNFIEKNNNTYPIAGSSKFMKAVTLEDIIELEKQFVTNSSKRQSTWAVRHFYLFTRDYRDGTKYELLDPKNVSSIKYSHFQTRPTYILIHGFLGYGLESWILTLKDKLLKYEDCNVISVDWPAGEEWFLPTYVTAADRVPDVGNNTATLLQSLVDYKGLLLESIHCVGHSLGGHVCGFAGKPFQGRVGKISGLDPAGPLYHNVNSSQRLDKKDAIYVDVMHTNACSKWPFWTDCYGLNENIGHSNFFPNGGEHQPGCWSKPLGGDIGCDHERAYMYYITSLDFTSNGTYYLARPCDNWINFESGKCSCGKNAQFMGFNVNTELNGEFYLETMSYAPFAVEDPECSTGRQWNIFIILGYVIVAGFVLCCVFSVVVLAVENIKRACCSPADKDDDDSLVSSEDDDEDSDDDEMEREDMNSRRENNTVPPPINVIISPASRTSSK